MDGVVMPDLTPKAQYYEVKKVYQNVGVKAVDMTKGQIEIFNKNYFEPFTDYQIEWSLWKDGKQVEKSTAMKARAWCSARARSRCTSCLMTTPSWRQAANTL